MTRLINPLRIAALTFGLSLPMATGTARAAPPGTHEVKVKCVYVSTAPDQKPAGGTAEVIVKVSPNTSGVAKITFPDSGIKPMADPLQNSAWGAAFCAAQATKHLITDFEFSVSIRGDIDGASGGLLFAAAMIAAINGDKVLPDVTISGTVNPDGTAGPVDRINYKMIGAQKAGIQTFGYPVGCRIQKDESTRQTVDLQDLVKSLRMKKAAELSDVYDAYELLTGKQIARPAALAEDKMQISSTLAQFMRKVADTHYASVEDHLKVFKKNAQWPKELIGMNQKVRDELKLSRLHQSEGAFALGLLLAESADAHSRIAEIYAQQVLNQTDQLDDLWRRIDEQQRAAESQLEGLRKFLQSKNDLTSVQGKLSSFYVYSNYRQIQSWVESAARLRAMPTPRATPGQGRDQVLLLQRANFSLEWLALAEAKADGLALWSENIEDRGPLAAKSDEMVRRLGGAYATTAEFGLNWYKSVFFDRDFNSTHTSEEVEQAIIQKETEYLPTLCATQLTLQAGKNNDKSLAALDQLASGSVAYLNVAGMINRRYNFPSLEGESIRVHRKTLGRDLDLARQHVLEGCGFLQRELGAVPDCIALNYELATAGRDGTDDDRLRALKTYWRCSFFCDFARTLLTDRAKSARPELPF